MSETWLRAWDRPNAIYANDRHRRVHCARIADDILSVLPSRSDLQVLDYGCGDALEAARVAGRVGRLFLYDAAPSTRARVAGAIGGVANLTVLDDTQFERLPAGSLDVITVSSVIQYVERPALPPLLRSFRRLLKDDGLLVIANVIPPECGMADDVRSLLTTAARHGFLAAALGGLAATLFSDYRRFRQRLGLSVYGDDQFRALLSESGFAAERLPRNFGFHPVRRTYLARPV